MKHFFAMCAVAALAALPAFAEPEVAGYTQRRTGALAGSVMYERSGYPGDALMLLPLPGNRGADAATSEEIFSLMEESGECAGFGSMSSDAATQTYRVHTSYGTPSCFGIVGADTSGKPLLVIGQSQTSQDVSGVRQGAEALMALKQGRSPAAATAARTPAPATPLKPAPQLNRKAVSDSELKSALSAIPATNVPVVIQSVGTSSFSGWPPSYVYTVTTHLYFANGYKTNCADWDPGLLAPTPQSLGKARGDCELTRWRKTGSKIQIEDEPGKWIDVDPEDETVRKFSPGQRLNIQFGNVGATGFNVPNGVSVGTISGDDLTMTSNGDIAAGSWSTTVISGSGVGGGSSQETQAIAGRYYLNGHLIAVADASGRISRGFIAGVNDGAVLGHIYLNGRHFWNRDD